jgi:ribosome-associated translation inhibitor RaiA
MKLSPTIAFRGVTGTDKLEDDIRKRLAKLERYCKSITTAHVMVEVPAKHHRNGNPYRVRIDLTVPGKEIVIRHDPKRRVAVRALGEDRARKRDEPDPRHRDARVAVREAFEAAGRRLQDYVRRQRGD